MRRALVLSGGGAMGSWQVGACEQLILERSYWFDVISGVSVGAINGAALAHGHDPGSLRAHLLRLRAWWLGVTGNHDVYLPRQSGAAETAGEPGWRGLYDVTPLRDQVLVREVDPPQVAASPIQLRVGYVDLRSRQYRTVSNENPQLREALLASASIPLVFPVTRVKGTRDIGVDGGLLKPAPLDDALRALSELPPDPEPAEVWMLMLGTRHREPPDVMVRRLLRSVSPRLRVQRGPDAATTRRADDCVSVTGSIQGRPFHSRVRVLRPAGELPASVLDFDPVKIRAWYADGLRAARAA